MGRRNLLTSFGDAFAGVVEIWLSERNMRIHTALAFAAIGVGHLGALSRGEWLLLSLVIVLVIAAELFNTAVEATVDLVTRKQHPLAARAKNAAAAAVLCIAAGAVAAGWWLFVPRLPTLPSAWRLWWQTRPLVATVWLSLTTIAALATALPNRPKNER